MYEFTAAPGLSLSFQRYPYPPAGTIKALPAAHGALPLHAAGEGRLILPSPDGEAFWIALLCRADAAPAAVRMLASTRDGSRLDILSGRRTAGPAGSAAVMLPPHRFIEGITRSGGTWWPLARRAPYPEAPSCDALDLLVCGARGADPPGTAPPPRPDAGSAGPTRHYATGETSPGPGPLRDPRAVDPSAIDCTGAAPLRIELMDEETFTAATGLPVPPLKPGSAYGGRRLP